MEEDKTITLPNLVRARFPTQDGNLERILEVAHSDDFLNETSEMVKRGNSPPFTLLVYDDLLTLGIYFTNGSACANVISYTDEHFMNSVDIALAMYKKPIVVIDKTGNQKKFMQCLKLRTDLDWIEYDPSTELLEEVRECFASKYFSSLSIIGRDLYAICEYEGIVGVVHMQIHNKQVIDRDKGLVLEGIECQGSPKVTYDNKSIDEVEQMIKSEHPAAMVIREPLFYCTELSDSKPFSCLATLFERAYAARNGTELGGQQNNKFSRF